MVIKQPVYGLILAGGFSKRMGQDKALLNYHGKPQVNYVHDLLLPYCENIFVSLREDQATLPVYQSFKSLIDAPEFKDKGPIGGILTALTSYPNVAWLVLACDLPFVTGTTIATLLAKRNPSTVATAFRSTTNQLPEPLCAIWEAFSLDKVLSLYQQGIFCPRKALIKLDAHIINQDNPQWLDNVNNHDEYQAALKILN